MRRADAERAQRATLSEVLEKASDHYRGALKASRRAVAYLKKRGIGILITDHNVRETLDICERAYIVGQGIDDAGQGPKDKNGNRLGKASAAP